MGTTSFLPSAGGALIDALAANSAANAQSTGAQNAIGTVNTATTTGDTGIGDASTLAQTGLNPYATSGAQATTQLAAGLAPGGNLSQTFTAADMDANDPGYQFRIDQGEQALQRQLAASGQAGGGAEKQLIDYGQAAGSQEYQNAFNRFITNQQDNVSNLSTLAGQGITAVTNQGNFGTTAANEQANYGQTGAQYVGNAQVFQGNAQAQGDVSVANAENAALAGVANDPAFTGTLNGISNNIGTWLGSIFS